MAKRGPDGAGSWYSADGRVGLGHRRLAIIDLTANGAQPMPSRDGRRVISFNGEIYNYRALRAELEQKGYRFESESDTEVLLHLYADRGEAMVHGLRGMFAFVIWDDNAGTMFLARDHFGIKPLYYSTAGGTLRVASEVKALLAGGGVETEPEPAGHVGFFLWGSVPDPYTLYRGIRALPAGSTLTVGPSCVPEPRVYADVPAMLRGDDDLIPMTSAEDAGEELRQALLDTMRHHLVADVDVGVFLSAGLDSTTQAALVAELGGRLRTVTLGFTEYRGTAQDEVPLAELVAARYGSDHQTIWVTREEFRAELDHLVARMDQPTIDGVNTFFVSKAAVDAGLKVALSGLGGDELFGGYPSFRQVPRLVAAASRVPAGRLIGLASRRLLAPAFRFAHAPKYAGVLEYGRDYGSAYLLRRCLFLPWELEQVLDRDIVREGWAALNLPGSIDAITRSLPTSRLKVSALESTLYMRNQLLRDTDWASMSFSLEARVPLVDWTLWRRIRRLVAGGADITKRLMAESSRPALPNPVLTRAKSGFALPTRHWLTAEVGRQNDEPGLRGWARYVHNRYMAESLGRSQLVGRSHGGRTVLPESGAGRIAVTTKGRIPRAPDALPATSHLHRATSSKTWNSLLYLLSRILGRITARSMNLSRVDKILVLQLQQLGDTVVFSPALRAVRARYPAARLDVLGNAISRSVYAKCSYIDRFHVAPTASPMLLTTEQWRLFRTIRRERYDLVVADATQRSLRYGLVALLCGARHRIGFDVDNRGFLFSTRLPFSPDMSVVDANMSLARALDATTDNDAVECYFDSADKDYAARLLNPAGGRPVVSIHPASNWQAKMWFPERWAALADALADRFDLSVFFVGSAAERAYVEEVMQHMKHPAVSLAGRTTLPQLSAFFARCELVVGTDSGPRHLAAGSGRPQITLMSAHDAVQRWHFGREHEIVLRASVPCSPCFQSYCWHQSCMKAISVEAVLMACDKLLQGATVSETLA